MPKILITGKGGKSGSWAMRGVQVGATLGATVMPSASRTVMEKHDVIIVAKKMTPQLLIDLKACGRPWIFDCIDFYPQPESYRWSKNIAIQWVKQRLNQYSPDAIIWATKAMMRDCNIGLPGAVIYHHHWEFLEPKKQGEIKVIGYEGCDAYPGELGPIVEHECQKRGWEFVINGDYRSYDAVLGLRGTAYSGYVTRQWKSNVKLANAHAAGIPFIGNKDSGYIETASGSEIWINNRDDISKAFDKITSLKERLKMVNESSPVKYGIMRQADEYRSLIDEIL